MPRLTAIPAAWASAVRGRTPIAELLDVRHGDAVAAFVGGAGDEVDHGGERRRFSGMPKRFDAGERPFYLPKRCKVPDPIPCISRIRLLHGPEKAQCNVEV